MVIDRLPTVLNAAEWFTLEADSLRIHYSPVTDSVDVMGWFCMISEELSITFDQLADPSLGPNGSRYRDPIYRFLDTALAQALSSKIGTDSTRPLAGRVTSAKMLAREKSVKPTDYGEADPLDRC